MTALPPTLDLAEGQRLLILIYHHIASPPANVRLLMLTFDDGLRDNYTAALPVLRRHAVPATAGYHFGLTTDAGTHTRDSNRMLLKRIPAKGSKLYHPFKFRRQVKRLLEF